MSKSVDDKYPEGSDYGRGFHGKYHAIRLYNRSLTVDEIQRNRIVDAARFSGVVPPTGAVFVDSAFSEISGIEPNGQILLFNRNRSEKCSGGVCAAHERNAFVQGSGFDERWTACVGTGYIQI